MNFNINIRNEFNKKAFSHLINKMFSNNDKLLYEYYSLARKRLKTTKT